MDKRVIVLLRFGCGAVTTGYESGYRLERARSAGSGRRRWCGCNDLCLQILYLALRRFKSAVRLDVLLYQLTRTGTYFRTFFSFFHKSRSSNISKLAITTQAGFGLVKEE
jgi:hypothetical protein